MPWTTAEKTLCVKTFFKTNNHAKVRAAFRAYYGHASNRNTPSRQVVEYWVKQFDVKGDLNNQRKGHDGRKTTRTPEKAQEVLQAVQRSPKKGVRKRAAQLNMKP